MTSIPSAPEILVIEDNPGDIKLLAHAFREAGHKQELRVARDGVEGLAYLRQDNPFGSVARPDLVLLDLNMPRKGGHEVLLEMKTDENLRTIPVFVYTSSEAKTDVTRAYELHANGYLVKPEGFSELLDLVRRLKEFWLEKIRLP